MYMQYTNFTTEYWLTTHYMIMIIIMLILLILTQLEVEQEFQDF